MRIFLIINLLIVIINSIEYRINNNCAWPDDCYITMKFTKTCAIESATAQSANRSKTTEEQILNMDDGLHHAFQCLGFPKESMIRCYNRCHRGPMESFHDIPENHIYQYTSTNFEKYMNDYKTLSAASDEKKRLEDFGYGRVQDKKEEYKFWNECVLKGFKNSTSKLANKESIAPIKIDLNCDQFSTFCRFVIEYALDGIKSIKSEKLITDMQRRSMFYANNAYSCRIFEKIVECICERENIRCQSFDHLIESIYLLGRDKVIRGVKLEQEDNKEKEYDERIPKVLEILQKFRTNYPKDIYGSDNLDCSASDLCSGSCYLQLTINSECEMDYVQFYQFRGFISPHRFVDSDRTGSIAVELKYEFKNLNMNVYCKMGCVNDFDYLYASILDVLKRQMETKEDIVHYKSEDAKGNKEEFFACAYYALRNDVLKRMYSTYEVPPEQSQTIREIQIPDLTISLIISTVLTSIFVLLILSIMVIGTISYFKSHTKKEPITFSKKTVIARRNKSIIKSAEFRNSKDKTGDFYDNISRKTSTMNHTDLASTVDDVKSRD